MAKQTEIPGTERKINKRVESAGEVLVDKTKKKTKANQDHKKAESELLVVMGEEKVPEYTSEALGKTFVVDTEPKVKVSAWKPPVVKTEDEDLN